MTAGGTRRACPQAPRSRAAHRPVLRNVREPRPEAAARVPASEGARGGRIGPSFPL
jgi:hypothetical protein